MSHTLGRLGQILDMVVWLLFQSGTPAYFDHSARLPDAVRDLL